MPKRILVIGALLIILTASPLAVLSILDVITAQQLRSTLGRTVSSIALMTAAAMLAGVVVRIGKKA